MRVDGDWSRQGLKMAKHTKKPAVINSPYDMCAIANMLQVLESIDYSTQVKFYFFLSLTASVSIHFNYMKNNSVKIFKKIPCFPQKKIIF